MLRRKQYIKGRAILTVDDLKNAPSTLFISVKDSTRKESGIDNPVNTLFSRIGEDSDIQHWLDKTLKFYSIWERIEEKREPIFSEEIDCMLDDMLSTFAYEYSDSEYHQEEVMEKLLKNINEKFTLEVKANE